MSPPLSDLHLHSLLAEALQLARLCGQGDGDLQRQHRRQERFRQIHTALAQFSHPMQSDPLPLGSIPQEVRRSFVEALLVMDRKRQLGGMDWQGSLTSPTLSRYCPDPVPLNPGEDLLDFFSQGFGLTAAEISSLQTQLQTVDRRIHEQKQIIAAVLADQDQPLPLFNTLLGPLPIPAAALTWVYTDTQIYFCLDYQGIQLQDPHLWDDLSTSDQQLISRFLEQLQSSEFERFHRFPIFGPCRSAQIDPDWCSKISQQTGISIDRIRTALSCSVSVIPTAKAEAFLIHDIWGHYWQWMLTQFESDYAMLASCDQCLRAAETAYTPQGPLSCRQIFSRTGDQVQIDLERARLFFRGEVEQRLGLMFTHLLGEMVADMAEFKFILDHPQSVEDLPSSSLFKTYPTKLDLSLTDLDYLFLRILQPLLEFTLSATTDSPLEQDLISDWIQPGETPSLTLQIRLKQALAQLAQIFFSEYEQTYLPQIQGGTSLFTQLVINLLYLQNGVNQLCTRQGSIDPTEPSFRDLLQVFIGCYCSRDSYAEFWQIDDILAAYFLPCWHHFRSLIQRIPPAPLVRGSKTY